MLVEIYNNWISEKPLPRQASNKKATTAVTNIPLYIKRTNTKYYFFTFLWYFHCVALPEHSPVKKYFINFWDILKMTKKTPELFQDPLKLKGSLNLSENRGQFWGERLFGGFLIEVYFYFSHKIIFQIFWFSIFEKRHKLKLNLLFLAMYFVIVKILNI